MTTSWLVFSFGKLIVLALLNQSFSQAFTSDDESHSFY